MRAVFQSLVPKSGLLIQRFIGVQLLIGNEVKVVHFIVVLGGVDVSTFCLSLGKGRTVAVAFQHELIHFLCMVPTINQILNHTNSNQTNVTPARSYQVIVDPLILPPAHMCSNARLGQLHLRSELSQIAILSLGRRRINAVPVG